MKSLAKNLEGYLFSLGWVDGKYGIIARKVDQTPSDRTNTHELQMIRSSRPNSVSPSLASSRRPLLRVSSTSLIDRYRGSYTRSSMDISDFILPVRANTVASRPTSQEKERKLIQPLSIQYPRPISDRQPFHDSTLTVNTTTQAHTRTSSIRSEAPLLYGLPGGASGRREIISQPTSPNPELAPENKTPTRKWPSLHLVSRIFSLLCHCAIFTIIVYYEAVEFDFVYVYPLPPLETFLSSESLAVTATFTSLAIAMSLFWDYYFARVARHTPYRLLLRSRNLPLSQEELLVSTLSPPTTVFSGIVLGLKHKDFLLGSVSLAGLLAKAVLPILMSHVPFRSYQTWELHLVTGWGTVAVLGYMILVLGASLVLVLSEHVRGRKGGLRTPVEMSNSLDCIAGAVYYLISITAEDGLHTDA